MPKYINSLDICSVASPSLTSINVAETAARLVEREQTNFKLSYEPLWPRVGRSVKHGADYEAIKLAWKNPALINAYACLMPEYAGAGTWYPTNQAERYILGMRVKPCVKGILFRDGHAEAHVINPRKSQRLTELDFSFLARAAFEEHCRDDPNNPIVVVIDSSSSNKNGRRELRKKVIDEAGLMSIDQFEFIVNRFFEAALMAGIVPHYTPEAFSADLFRRY